MCCTVPVMAVTGTAQTELETQYVHDVTTHGKTEKKE